MGGKGGIFIRRQQLCLKGGVFLVVRREEEVNKAANVCECHDEDDSDDFSVRIESIIEEAMKERPNPDSDEA